MKQKLLPLSAPAWWKRLLAVAAFTLAAAAAQAQVYDWVHPNQTSWTTTIGKVGRSIATDAAGNIYAAAETATPVTFGTLTIPVPGGGIYLAKLSPSGQGIWGIAFLQTGAAYLPKVYDLKADPAGNTYVTGTFEGTLTVGATTLTPVGMADCFIAKISATGTVLWVKQGKGAYMERFNSISMDGDGNVYIAGYSTSSHQSPGPFVYDNQPVPMTILNQSGEYLIKTDPNGNFLWSKVIIGNISEVSVTPGGKGLLTGTFVDSLNLGNGIVLPGYISAQDGTGFVAAFSTTGQFEWGNYLASHEMKPMRVRADQSGNVFVSGFFKGYLGYGSISNFMTGGPGTNDMFLLKTDPTGNLLWMRGMNNFSVPKNNSGTGGPANPNAPQLELDGAGNPIIANLHKGAVKLSPSVTVGPVNTFPPNHNFKLLVAKYDQNGTLIWHLPVLGEPDVFLTGMSVTFDSRVRLSGFLEGSSDTAHFSYAPISINNITSFIASIISDPNHISGSVFADLNSSGTREAGEYGIPNLPVHIQPGSTVYTDANGKYTYLTDTGNFQITLPQVPLYHTNLTGSHTANFNGMSQTDSANHFALHPQPGVQDLRINMASPYRPNPGYSYRTRLTYRNVGTTVMTGSVHLIADPVASFTSASTAPSSVAGDTLKWDFTALQPFEVRHLVVDWQVAMPGFLGDSVINLTATINPITGDQTPADNTVTVNDPIMGSFDPNDKLVSHASLTPSQVSAGEWLTYTVRFQNTGTDTARYVLVRDELRPLLDLATMEVLSSSHPFSWSMSSPATVEWNFGRIDLPDSSANEAASHGYIQYRIKPLSTLVAGEHIRTQASIFFDFNAAIVTNTTDTEVSSVTAAIASIGPEKLRVWPNPNTGRFTVQLPSPGTEATQVRILNALGQTIYDNRVAVNQGGRLELQLPAFSSGMYMLQLQQGGSFYTSPVLIEKP